MNSKTPFSNHKEELILPFMGGFYEKIAQPLAWTAFRVAIGGALALEGYRMIQAPFALSGFVESIGFYPGWLWSLVLAITQFFGGILIAIGLFTRPAALASAVMLAITLWFHIANPYGPTFLTAAGMEALAAADQTLFTPSGAASLADGGAFFLTLVQGKAVTNSLFWTGGAALFAAFGGGYLSVDKLFLKKRF